MAVRAVSSGIQKENPVQKRKTLISGKEMSSNPRRPRDVSMVKMAGNAKRKSGRKNEGDGDGDGDAEV